MLNFLHHIVPALELLASIPHFVVQMLRRPTTARHPASESRSAGCARPKAHHLYQRSPLSAGSMGCEARSHVLRLGENDGFEEW
jgi:hypothetical protein